jgi:hypothetical protein
MKPITRLGRRSWPLAAAVLVIIAISPSLLADQQRDWNIVVATNAFIGHGTDPDLRGVAPGTVASVGDRITTRAGGAVVLARGQDLITMAENTQISITDPQPASKTVIEQPYGQAQYHVTHEVVPHFEVDTPMLATVVKGTTFTVKATATDSRVSVQDGRVTAVDRHSGASSSVGSGQTGSVGNGSASVSVGASPSTSNTPAPAASAPTDPAGPGAASAGPGAGPAGESGAKNKDKAGDKPGSSAGGGAGAGGRGGGGGPGGGGPGHGPDGDGAGGDGSNKPDKPGKADKPDKSGNGPRGGKNK